MIGHYAVPQRVTRIGSVPLQMERLLNGVASADIGEIICVLGILRRMQWVLKVDSSVEKLLVMKTRREITMKKVLQE